MRIIRVIITLLLLVFLGAAGPLCFAKGPVPWVRVNGSSLSLDVKNEPLTTILDELTRAGIRVRIDPTINPLVTASFTNRPVGSGLESIIRPFDYALVWGKEKGDESGLLRLREIQIFQKGGSAESLPLYGRTHLMVEQGAGGIFYVADTLLLRFDPSMSLTERRALLDDLGATIVEVPVPGIFRLQLPEGSDVEAIAARLARVDGIQRAEPDYAYSLAETSPVLLRQSSTALADAPATAGGTTVAVLDSGLSGDFTDSLFVAGAYDAVSSGALAGDPRGHGTQMALIASGTVLPLGAQSSMEEGTPIVAIRAFDDNGYTSDSTLMRGINFALETGTRVLSISWGTEQKSAFLESAMNYASGQGLIVVAAAGNTPSGKPVYPAAFNNVIGVGALMPDGTPWDQSNFGPFVSTYGPGLADLPVGSDGVPGIYAGTSIATAATARRVAQLLDKDPTADLNTILNQLPERK